MSWFILAAGGFCGACARFLLSIWLNGKGRWGATGTWIANITGSALFSLLWVFTKSEWLWLFAGIGFSGAFTTFSTFGKETVDLMAKGDLKGAVLYILFSVLLSLSIIGLIFFLFS